MIKILQAVQIMQIPGDRSMLTIDLECIECLVATGVTRRFEICQRTVREAREKQARIINTHLLGLAGDIMVPFLDENLSQPGNLVNSAIQPKCGVNAVRQQISSDTTAGHAHIEAPKPLPALRQVL